MSALLTALALAAGAPDNPAAECEAVAGWDEVLADETARFLVVGEMHGTAETPALFSDVVCQSGQTEPVVVALEFASSVQDDIDRYMASDGGTEARTAFLQAAIWNPSAHDGRSSEAMFAMFEDLRRYRHAGLVSRVVAFQPDHLGRAATREEREQSMADVIVEAGKGGERVLVLVGNVHARLEEVPYGGGYMPMAGHLPSAATLSFDTAGNGGEAWACNADLTCGPLSLGTSSDPQERHVALADDDADTHYSGTIHLGTTTTFSPPRLNNEEQS